MIYLYDDDLLLIRYWEEALHPYKTESVSFAKEIKAPSIAIMSSETLFAEEELFIRAIADGAKLFILDRVPSFEDAQNAIRIGALGYANAMMHAVHLRSAVQAIRDGHMWLYPDFVSRLIMQSSAVAKPEDSMHLQKLTIREKEVAILLSHGATQYEIAQKLDISIRTVKAHTSSIYEKLSVKDRLALSLLLRS
jgi:DNA-binding NarL/FixJ family response regulator